MAPRCRFPFGEVAPGWGRAGPASRAPVNSPSPLPVKVSSPGGEILLPPRGERWGRAGQLAASTRLGDVVSLAQGAGLGRPSGRPPGRRKARSSSSGPRVVAGGQRQGRVVARATSDGPTKPAAGGRWSSFGGSGAGVRVAPAGSASAARARGGRSRVRRPVRRRGGRSGGQRRSSTTGAAGKGTGRQPGGWRAGALRTRKM
jgi:hypothetical protein